MFLMYSNQPPISGLPSGETFGVPAFSGVSQSTLSSGHGRRVPALGVRAKRRTCRFPCQLRPYFSSPSSITSPRSWRRASSQCRGNLASFNSVPKFPVQLRKPLYDMLQYAHCRTKVPTSYYKVEFINGDKSGS